MLLRHFFIFFVKKSALLQEVHYNSRTLSKYDIYGGFAMAEEQTRYSRLAQITKLINTKLDLREVVEHVVTAIS